MVLKFRDKVKSNTSILLMVTWFITQQKCLSGIFYEKLYFFVCFLGKLYALKFWRKAILWEHLIFGKKLEFFDFFFQKKKKKRPTLHIVVGRRVQPIFFFLAWWWICSTLSHFENGHDVLMVAVIDRLFVSPELSSVRDYVITHSVRSMYVVCVCMYVVICKIDHCIHIHWCIVMGPGHNDPWVESHMWPQQTWGQRSCRGQWPLVQVFGKKDQCIHILWCIFKSNITMTAKVCARESRRDSWFENRLV